MQQIPMIGGWIPNEPDGSADKFATLKQVIYKGTPSDGHIISESTPISSQGSLSSCVGNGFADALEIILGLQKRQVVQLSRLFIYWNSRHEHGATGRDKGTRIQLAGTAVRKHGVCREDDWPYDYAKVNTQPDIWSYENGEDNKITGLFNIDDDSDAVSNIVTSIDADHPVICGLRVGQEFADYQDRSELDNTVFDAPANPIGNHCMIITGYRYRQNSEVEFLLRNSWGPRWGFNGHCWISSDYIRSAATSDYTVPTYVPDIL